MLSLCIWLAEVGLSRSGRKNEAAEPDKPKQSCAGLLTSKNLKLLAKRLFSNHAFYRAVSVTSEAEPLYSKEKKRRGKKTPHCDIQKK